MLLAWPWHCPCETWSAKQKVSWIILRRIIMRFCPRFRVLIPRKRIANAGEDRDGRPHGDLPCSMMHASLILVSTKYVMLSLRQSGILRLRLCSPDIVDEAWHFSKTH